MKNSFANEIRNILTTAGPVPLFLDEIYRKADAVGTKDKRKVMAALREFKKVGELEMLTGSGSQKTTYRYIGKQTPSIKDKMWAILRARKIVSVEDLQEMTGAAAGYALEWLQGLARQQVVLREAHGIYRMISDPVIQPENVDKNERQRRIRAEKKALLEKMDQAMNALLEVRLAVSGIGKEMEAKI